MVGQDQRDLQEMTQASFLFDKSGFEYFGWGLYDHQESNVPHPFFVFISLQYALLKQLFVRCKMLSHIHEAMGKEETCC